MTSFVLENQYQQVSGAMSFFYNWGDHWINDGYAPSKDEVPQEGRFNSFDDMMGLSFFQSIQFLKNSRVTLGFDWFRYGGKAWTEFVLGDKAGDRNDLVNKHENEVAGYMDFRQDMSSWLTFNAGIRVDHHSRVGTEWIPQVGFAFHLPRKMELKVSATKGFRYPVLREMYMFPPQNPDLKPESMWNYEIAFSQRLLDNSLSYGINLFYIDGKNLIMALPNPNGSGMLNQNSGEIKNAGLELQMAYRINRSWSVDANYSFLHMDNPVVAAPEHKFYAGTNFASGRWNVSTGLQYVSGLYTSVSPVVKENFVLWNLRASFRLTQWMDIWARGENLLAQKYEINTGYPMPRTTVMAGVNVHF